MSLKRFGLVRVVAVVVLLALVAAACSGGSDDSGADGDALFEVEEVAEALIESAGGDAVTATVALLTGLDRGYDLRTVAAAALAGLISADGIVETEGGETVAPEGSDAGVITDKAPRSEGSEDEGAIGFDPVLVVFTQDGTEPVTTGALADSVRSNHGDSSVAGALALGDLVVLLANGYSHEQIINAFIFGESLDCSSDDEDEDGCTLGGEPPANPPIIGLFTALGTTEDSDAGGDEPSSDPSGEAAGDYVGTFNGVESTDVNFALESVLDGEIVVEVTEDDVEVVGSARIAFEPDNSDLNADVVCQAELVLEVQGPVDMAVRDGAQVTGTIDVQGGVFDGTCSAGSQDNVLTTFPFLIEITFSDDSLNGSLEGAFVVASFEAERVG